MERSRNLLDKTVEQTINKLTRRTLTTDAVIGEILDSNNVFIPIAVGPNGEFGSLFRRFLNGSNPLPLPTFRDDRPNAIRAADLRPFLTKPPLTSSAKQIKAGKGNMVTNYSAVAAQSAVWFDLSNQSLYISRQN
jgi:hypothetical protein